MTASAQVATHGPDCVCEHFLSGKGIRSYGVPRAAVMIVGIAPGRQEMIRGRPLVGPSGMRNDKMLALAGYPRERVNATNLICWWKDDPDPEEILACWPRLRDELRANQPALIVTLGALATEWLTGRKIGKTRGAIIHPGDNMSPRFAECFDEVGFPPCVMPTWHPAASLYAPQFGADILRDYKKIPRFVHGELSSTPWRLEIIKDKAQAQQTMYWLSGRRVALDVETTFDNEDAFGHVTCLSVATRLESGIVAYVFPRELLDDVTWPARGSVDWGFHNGPFDTQAIKRTFGVDLDIGWDTMMESVARDERPSYDREGTGRNKPVGPGLHGLKQLSRELCGAGFYEERVKGKLGEEWHAFTPGAVQSYDGLCALCGEAPETHLTLEEFYLYNAEDSVHTLVLPDRLPSKGVARQYLDTMLMPGTRALARIQYEGIPINAHKLDEFVVTWSLEYERLGGELVIEAEGAGFSNPVKRRRSKERNEISAKTGKAIFGFDEYTEPFNPASPDQIAKVLYQNLGLKTRERTKGGKPSTSEDTLTELDHPFIDTLLRYRKYSRAVQNLEVLRKHIRPDGRVHPTALPLVTGRYSWIDPPMQTFVQPYTYENAGYADLAELRSVVEAPPGMVLAEADYQQIEIHTAAWLSNDANMKADLEEDFHTRVTRTALRCDALEGTPEFGARRRDAKVVTFAIMFKEGAKKLASKQVGINCPVPEAERYIREWYRRYFAFKRYQDQCVRDAQTKGYLKTPFGFIRRFPLYDAGMDPQIVNCPVQSTAYGHTHISMVSLVDPGLLAPSPWPEDLDIWTAPFHGEDAVVPLEQLGGRVLLSVHDSLLFALPEEPSRMEACLHTIRRVMESPKLPGWPGMKVTIKLGHNWRSVISEKEFFGEH